MSFQHFCRLDGMLHIPDARTLWHFKQHLAQGGLGGRAIFDAVSQQLQAHGYIPRGGQIVDASIVQAPVTQAKSEEREALNEGKPPEGWSSKRVRHTDRDARWTKKHGKSYYGYKVHANSDARYKLIRKLKVTPANVDDGQTLADVLDASNTGKRARGEHVFAGLEQLGGKCVRALTLARNELAILLKCSAYNVKRLVWLVGNDPLPWAR